MRLELQVEGRESPRSVVHALFSSAIRIVIDCLRFKGRGLSADG